MKILYISYAIQHPKMRGSTRTYYFLRELSKHHTVTLMALSRSEVPPEIFEDMSKYAERVVAIDTSRMTAPGIMKVNRRLRRSWQEQAGLRQMKQTLHQLVQSEPFDGVLFHGKSAFSVIEHFSTLPLVVDFCDATTMRIRAEMSYTSIADRPLMLLHYLKMREVERKLILKTPYLSFISCRDRDATLGGSEISTVQVIPNGVDLDYWQRRLNQPCPKRLIFTGVMDYKPNEDAAIYMINEILPRLKRSMPEVEICIAGRDPTPKLKNFAQQHSEVKVTGFVNDMRDYLEQAVLFVAPLRYASGMQNKIQEAFAMGIPVVTTPVVAAGMVPEGGGKPPLYVANGAQEFADRILDLMGNPAERTRLANAGRRFAEDHFVWSRSGEALASMCQEAFSDHER